MAVEAAAKTHGKAASERTPGEVAVLSRHTGARNRRCEVRAWNLNAWCTISGNPFVGPVTLLPNHPEADLVSVEFGPMQFRNKTDTLTFFLVSSNARRHDHVHAVELAILDRGGRELAVARPRLRLGETVRSTLTFGEAGPTGVTLRMAIGFDEFSGGSDFGTVSLSYLLGHRSNELVDLFNAAGSDKGTEVGIGRGAAPHCYAVEYHQLFSELRAKDFRMLEIGLQSNWELPGYVPDDAPSLRVWREYFPRAAIVGYDINDFSFFEQERTTVFRGDQGSREDLQRFIDQQASKGFELVLDDGSHASSHQQISLGALFPLVAKGGMYVIEDLHWQPFPENPTTLEMLRDYNECGRFRSPFLSADEARYLESHVDRVAVHRPNDSEFAVIYKRAD